MPAAVAKGIIISLSIIAALGIAVLENPQVQSWLEEQRRKIAELLRSVGQDLDPENRRRAEAFAFEGRTAMRNEENLQDAAPSLDAVASATGRSLSRASTVRRIPIQGPTDPDMAEERRRKGKEYLAKRNQQMIELQERRKTASTEALVSPPTPTSFDAWVDGDGNLMDSTSAEKEQQSGQSVPDPIPDGVREEMKEVERQLEQPILSSESSTAGASGWQTGSMVANPFGDEYALDRSITPRPASPREDRVERTASPIMAIPGSFGQAEQDAVNEHDEYEGLTYEEQLAIAMSLSEQESVANAATLWQRSAKEAADFRRAVRASLKDQLKDQLKDLKSQQADHAVVDVAPTSQSRQPLIDLTPSATVTAPEPQHNEWLTLYLEAQRASTQTAPSAPRSETTDELYSVTPQLTRARLASFDAQQDASRFGSALQSQTFNHFQEAAGPSQPEQKAQDATFFSVASIASPAPSSHTLDNEIPQLIDISEDTPQEGMRTPTSHAISAASFRTDSDSETLESVSIAASRTPSHAPSEASGVHVGILEDDSDVDMLSEEGDGIATPDSWSEVGSKDAESETEDGDLRPAHSSS